jgi:hypothetical protein
LIFFAQNIQKNWRFWYKKDMHPILRSFKTAYIEAHHLLPLLQDYTNPRDLIARLVKSGDLIRLRNGFYLIAEKIQETRVPLAQIANLLYGPSYISFEWALSYYGLIPEGVFVVTSTSAVKPKSYTTPLGTFDYHFLNHSRYSIGISQREDVNGHFLIATPEKALADLVHLKSKGLKSKDLIVDLVESRRIDEEGLKQLNKAHLLEIAECYHSQTVNQLVNTLGLL